MFKETLEHKVLQAHEDLLEVQELQDLKDLLDLKEALEHKDKASKVIPVMRVL